MTLYDYDESKGIAQQGFQFYALIMAAMRQADTDNLTRLQAAFPEVWRELQARYNAPLGKLASDDDATALDLLYDPDTDSDATAAGE